jgi:protein-disulfide isomerase
VRVVYKNYLIHDVVRPVHQAGCAAAMQGKFVAFKNAWWQQAYGTGKYDQAEIDAIAKAAGLDLDKFHADQDSDACKQRVAKDGQELEVFHVESTPSFFINGSPLLGPPTPDRLKEMIDQKLQQVQQSGVACPDYYDQVVMAKGLKQFKSAADAKK